MLADIVKIHCLTHRANFPMSRTSRSVVCKEGPEEHVLSNDFPNTGLWIYCCNCQTFIAWETERADVTVRECPFCLSSLNPRLYCCDHCAVTMLDFDDPTLRKHHIVLSWGMPQPACPGCHQFPSSTPRIHFCVALQSHLATARNVCPFCKLQLETIAVDNPQTSSLRLDAALAEAERRALSAEESARKESQLRVQAEQKASDFERELIRPSQAFPDPEIVRKQEEFSARADSEARARAMAEVRAREAEEMRFKAEEAARNEAEMRAQAERKAREIVETFTTRATQNFQSEKTVPGKDRVSIALYAAITMFLFLALIMLMITMFRLYYAS
ncbi:MAG: hypothetical protein IPG76_13340 [Acidobacteria bacterium]|nr:hypothetical protein [Acidobacteriota bacterium]